MARKRSHSRGLNSIPDVAAQNLCSGCGVCAAAMPDTIRMVETASGERRPLLTLSAQAPSDTAFALSVCPGAHLRHDPKDFDHHLHDVSRIWGPVLEVWEGYAADPDIRWRGSSGGVVTALALHQLTSGQAAGVLHTGPRADDPARAETVLSRDREGLLAGAGSRYAPASPGEGLGLVEAETGPCVVVGKPCDVAGTRMLGLRRKALSEKVSLTIGIFCAGTPSQGGTTEAIRSLGLDPSRLTGLRWRGHGWPGRFVATTSDGATQSLTYEQSWGAILQKHRQWRCMVCADHTGEFADLAVGDPWYRPVGPGDPGRSLVLVRTDVGRRAVQAAMVDGALVLERVPSEVIEWSQPNLVKTRGAVWGRVITMRILGRPSPYYQGLPMFPTWLRRLTVREKLQSTLGTVIRLRRLRRANSHGPSGDNSRG